MIDARKPTEETSKRNNGLQELVMGLGPSAWDGAPGLFGQTISGPGTLRKDTFAGLLTLDWVTLSQSYAHIGLVQTLIDQPIEDAMRGGFKIETNGQLNDDDMAELIHALQDGGESSDIQQVIQAMKWARLFGGSGLILATDQDPKEEFDVTSLKIGDMAAFISANRWEVLASFINIMGFQSGSIGVEGEPLGALTTYQYYDVPSIHESRVSRILGVPAPHWIRQQLMGWGMSELERCLREINSFLKFQDLLFELIDEAKIDVYKIQGFNAALASVQGQQAIQTRIQLSNMLKNYKNAVVMDENDDYIQKQLGTVFNGLAAIYEELRMNLSAALKIPINKLFGTSASGLNASGEDAIENYNALVETVRKKIEPVLKVVITVRCQVLFGFVPDFTIQFAPLRVLSAGEEEVVKTSKQKRATDLFDKGVMSVESLEETLTKDGLLSVKLEKSPEFRDQQLTAGNPAKDANDPADKKATRKENAVKGGLEWLREQKRAAMARR